MPRIYVACLAAYNNGRLHGKWIEATSDQDEMQDEVSAMLRTSPYPNVMVQCPDCMGTGESFPGVTCQACGGRGEVHSAEEYAIHDMEGLPSSFGEYVGLDTVADYVALLEDFDYLDEDVIAAVYDNFRNLEETRSALKDNFVGIYSSFQAYAEEAADEWLACYDIKDDNPLMQYFDCKAYARDLADDMMTVDTSEGVAVFHYS